MGPAVAPLFATAAGLLAVAGASKLRAPATARLALGTIGVPAGDAGLRALGAGELALGVVCLARPSPVAAGCLAAAYLGFALVMALMLRAGDEVPCGCFGAESFSPSKLHVALDLGGFAAGALAAIAGPRGLATLAGGGWIAVPVLAGVGFAVALAYMAFTAVPVMWRSYGVGGESR